MKDLYFNIMYVIRYSKGINLTEAMNLPREDLEYVSGALSRLIELEAEETKRNSKS